jgi:hypothetical protein
MTFTAWFGLALALRVDGLGVGRLMNCSLPATASSSVAEGPCFVVAFPARRE